jgi:AraC-like DNA-binding protein
MKPGRERHSGNKSMARHMHPTADMAVVLSGGYEEAGDGGRFHVRAGDVVMHAPFDSHLDRFTPKGAHILSLPAWHSSAFKGGFGHINDPDLIVRVAERDLAQAAALVLASWREHSLSGMDWPEQLAQTLAANPELYLNEWAREFGLAAATVSRGFKQVFGITPSRFRAHSRAKLAWAMIAASDAPLCRIAADLGFSDQSHMTRHLRSLTGKTPLLCRTERQIDSRLPGARSI